MEQFERVPMPRNAENAILTLAEQATRYWPIGQWWVVTQPEMKNEAVCVVVEEYVTDFHEDRRVRATIYLQPDGNYTARALRFHGDRHLSRWE